MVDLKVSNFAISWKAEFEVDNTKRSFEKIVLEQKTKPKTARFYANFAVVRYDNIKSVYIIFYSGHVNCTGVSKPSLILPAIDFFSQTFSVKVSRFRIKAIAATATLKNPLEVRNILQILKTGQSEIVPSIVSNRFTGLMIRFKKGGSAQIFYSGKINYLGACNLTQLKYMNSFVKRLVKSNGVQTPC